MDPEKERMLLLCGGKKRIGIVKPTFATYISIMQLKHATAIIVLLFLFTSLSVAGCTSSSNKATINPLAADNLAGAINDRYKALSYNGTLNYTVKTPFTMTKQDDKITYHGVIAEPPGKFTLIKTFNVTIVLTTSKSTAEDIYKNSRLALKENRSKGGLSEVFL